MNLNKCLEKILLFAITMPLLLLTACTGVNQAIYDAAMEREIRKAGLTRSSLNTGDLEIAVLEGEGRGERPCMVLVHGFGASKEIWLRFARHLKDDFHLVVVDLPGHGKSSKQTDLHYGLDSQADYLQAIIAEMAPGSYHLAGNSMGGSIVALLAARNPDKLASITLFNPGGVHAHESELSKRLANGDNPLIVNSRDDYKDLLDFSMKKKPLLFPPVVNAIADEAISNRDIRSRIFNDILQFSSEDFKSALTAISIPALIVWGRHDRLISAENGRVFDLLIPDSRLVILEEVGHVPMIEAPETAAMLTKGFALSLGGR